MRWRWTLGWSEASAQEGGGGGGGGGEGRVECNHNERHSVHDTMLISQSARTGNVELRDHF